MMLSKRLSAALLGPFAVAALALPACGGNRSQVATNGAPIANATTKPSGTPTTTKPAATTSTTSAKVDVTVPPFGIVIENFKYSDVVAKAHQVTKVVNKDTAPHTLTADDLSFDTKTIEAGATGEFTAPGPGTYKIHCVLHPFMTADLTVVK